MLLARHCPETETIYRHCPLVTVRTICGAGSICNGPVSVIYLSRRLRAVGLVLGPD